MIDTHCPEVWIDIITDWDNGMIDTHRPEVWVDIITDWDNGMIDTHCPEEWNDIYRTNEVRRARVPREC